jgi:asparagine synthetase B (glutamine-hydrolysing)
VSGGLDSSGVLANAVAIGRGASRPEIDAVTWSFGGPFDDRPYLQELCDALGIVPIRVSSVQASLNVLRGLVADAAPSIWPAAAGILTAQQHARERGAEVIITGMGGDQVLGGEARIWARRLMSGHWREALILAARFQSRSIHSPLVRAARLALFPPISSVLPAIHWMKRRRFAAQRWPWAGPRLREFVRNVYLRQSPNREWKESSNVTRVERLIRTDFVHISEFRRQMEVGSGITRVDPLTDDEVVTVLAGFPKEAMLFGSRERGLYRHAMRQILPERLRLRLDKACFEPAFAEMVNAADLEALRDLASMKMMGDLGLVDPPAYRSHFATVLAAGGKSIEWLAIWPALAAEAFARWRWSAR